MSFILIFVGFIFFVDVVFLIVVKEFGFVEEEGLVLLLV